MSQEQIDQLEAFGQLIGQFSQQQQQRLAELKSFASLISEQIGQLTQQAQLLGQYDLAAKFKADQQALISGLGVLTDRVGGVDLAAEITGKARSTIYSLVSMGKIPAFKNGGRLRFSEAALRAYSFQANGFTTDK